MNNSLRSPISKQALLQTVSAILMYLIGFLLPFRIDLLLFISPLRSIVGQQQFYAASFLHITELLLLSCFVITPFLKRTPHKSHKYERWITSAFLLIIAALLLSTGFALDSATHLLHARWFAYAILLWFLVRHHKQQISAFIYGIASVSLFQVIMIIGQVTFGHSIGLHLLGEPHLGADILTSAHYNILGIPILRGYGTFDHPNIASAWLAISLYLMHQTWRQNTSLSWFRRFSTIALLLGIILTGSKLMIITVGVITMLTYLTKQTTTLKGRIYAGLVTTIVTILIVVLTLSSNITFITDRLVQYSTVTFEGIRSITGSGLGLSSLSPAFYSNTSFAPWSLQPIHNVPVLYYLELGILGFAAVSLLYISSVRQALTHRHGTPMILFALLALGITSLFDHYFLTAYPTFLLFFLMMFSPFFKEDTPKS